MSNNSKNLFASCTRIAGYIRRLPANQNEREGKIQIEIWNAYGVGLVSWKGYRIPQHLLDEIQELEEAYNVSSGLYNLDI